MNPMNFIKIKNITFHSSENNFVIFKDENDLIYQGQIFHPYLGQTLEVKSEIIKTNYGDQHKILFVKYFPPQSQNELINLLSCGLVSKIGIKTAQKIVSNFNVEDFFKNPKNYNIKVNSKLKKLLEDNLLLYKNFIFSQELFLSNGFSQDSIIKINELFQDKSSEILKNNPYQFYKKIPSLTFKFLDAIAQKNGLSTYSKDRLISGTYACIDEFCELEKCSGIKFDNLHELGYKFLEIDDAIYYSSINKFLDEDLLCEVEIDKVLLVSTPQIYYTELSIANNLKRLSKTKIIFNITDTSSILPEFLSIEQKKSINILLNNKIAILTGIPGSGKTTIIKYAIDLYQKQNFDKKVYISTPTGKAAQRVRETNVISNVSTNHKLLGFLPNGEFVFNENNKLKLDLLVLDEASMIDMFMFNSLLKALPENAQIWIIGDSNQLASIQLGNVLQDLIDSNTIKYTNLTEAFRQEKNSQILKNAIKVINKELLILPSNKKDQDFYFFNKTNEKEIAQSTIDLFFKVKNNKSYNFNQLQILCPQKTTLCGVDYLNSQIQLTLNKGGQSIKWKDKEFFKNDKVIQTINDYDRNVFNGDIGFIKDFSVNNNQLVVEINGTDIIYEKSQIYELDLAYAISIHKFQGSECNAVIMPVSSKFMRMMTPKLLYTGMTRAKELLILNGDLNVLNHCIENNKDIDRKTLLKHFLLNKK